jgi:hypothetical protein
VSYTATSTKGQRSGHNNAVSFKITKTPPKALSVKPSPVVVGVNGTSVNVQAFWGRHVDGAYATLTAPGGKTLNANMARAGGTPNWGLWKTAPTLPKDSRPGTWKIATQFVSGGVWSTGPSTTITVKQHSALSLKSSPRTALRRVEDHALPLESARAQVAYGQPSAINRLLILNAEPHPGRGTVLLLREAIGF